MARMFFECPYCDGMGRRKEGKYLCDECDSWFTEREAREMEGRIKCKR